MPGPLYPAEMATAAAYPCPHTSGLEAQFLNPQTQTMQLAAMDGLADATPQVKNAIIDHLTRSLTEDCLSFQLAEFWEGLQTAAQINFEHDHLCGKYME